MAFDLEFKIEDSFIYKKGKKEGKLEGKKAGKKEGKKEGKLEGKLEGEKSKRDQMILALLKKGKFSHEDIAEAAEMIIEYVEELANKLKK